MKKVIISVNGINLNYMLKNYGRDLNRIKNYLVKEFKIDLDSAFTMIKALNRRNFVLFNNGVNVISLTLVIKEENKKGLPKLLSIETEDGKWSDDNDVIKVNTRYIYIENYYGSIKRINRKNGNVYVVDDNCKKYYGKISNEDLKRINKAFVS